MDFRGAGSDSDGLAACVCVCVCFHKTNLLNPPDSLTPPGGEGVRVIPRGGERGAGGKGGEGEVVALVSARRVHFSLLAGGVIFENGELLPES